MGANAPTLLLHCLYKRWTFPHVSSFTVSLQWNDGHIRAHFSALSSQTLDISKKTLKKYKSLYIENANW